MAKESMFSKMWSVLVEPDRFFSRLKERSPWPSIAWLAGGIAFGLFVGGPLSILLSVAAGVPLAKAVGFVTESDPGAVAFAIYFAVLVFVEIFAVVLSVFFAFLGSLLANAMGAKGGFQETLQIVAYASTPSFLASGIPQMLLYDVSIAPTIQVLSHSYNYTVDFIQLAALVFSMWLTFVACRRVFKMSTSQAVGFLVVPLIAMASLLGLFVVAGILFALL